MIQANVEKFFETARERYSIMLRREGKIPNPHAPSFTTDKVFKDWRFCNTFREDDQTTRWVRMAVREPLAGNYEKLLFGIIAARWFNRVSTCAKILPDLLAGPMAWNADAVREKLKDCHPLVTGAYVIKTPNGYNKLDGLLVCLENIRRDFLGQGMAYGIQLVPREERTMEDVWRLLCEFPYLGDFMAYQIVSDLRHTCWLDRAQDAMFWASPGPGSARGMGWVAGDNPELYKRTNRKHWALMLNGMQTLVCLSRNPHYWPIAWPAWEMQTVQHWLCEYDKYTRASKGQEQKRRFNDALCSRIHVQQGS